MQDRRIVHSPNAPAALGPYSQAVVHGGLVYCSGQVGIDPATGKFVEGGVEAQARQVLTNLKNVLSAADSELDAALMVSVFVADMDDFKAVNEVYASFFGDEPPARATVQVGRLPADALVEISCVAAVK